MKSEGSTFLEVSWVLPQALQVMPLVSMLFSHTSPQVWRLFPPYRGRYWSIKKIISPQLLLRKPAWGHRLPDSRAHTCDEPRTLPPSNRWAWDSISEHRTGLRAGFFYKKKLKSGGKEGAKGFLLCSSCVAARGELVHRTRPTQFLLVVWGQWLTLKRGRFGGEKEPSYFTTHLPTPPPTFLFNTFWVPWENEMRTHPTSPPHPTRQSSSEPNSYCLGILVMAPNSLMQRANFPEW